MDGAHVKLCNIDGDSLISLSYLFLHVLKYGVIINKPKFVLLCATLRNNLTDVHMWHWNYDSSNILMV